jgi:hypothetical protein
MQALPQLFDVFNSPACHNRQTTRDGPCRAAGYRRIDPLLDDAARLSHHLIGATVLIQL